MGMESATMNQTERHIKNSVGFGVVTGIILVVPVFIALSYAGAWGIGFFYRSQTWEMLPLWWWSSAVGSVCISSLAGVKVFRFLRQANIS
jgi:hypothetical protein